MDWIPIGRRIRTQREFFGYTREQFAEMLDVTPKFCSDIELGVKGMSIPTLCKISGILHLSTDYILFGTDGAKSLDGVMQMLQTCTPEEVTHAETLLRDFLLAVNDVKKGIAGFHNL